MRQRHQVVVVEAEQRRLEDGGKRQIVLGRQQEVAERHEVLHGHLLGQEQPVGAGDVDAARLQRRDHDRRERLRACVPGSGCRRRESGGPRDGEHLAVLDPAVDGGGDARGQAHDGRRSAHLRQAATRAPSRLGRLDGSRVGQISTRPACPARLATWRTALRSAVTPGVRSGFGEDAVDGRQQRLNRAERQRERDALPGHAAWPARRAKLVAYRGEHGGRCALEAVDGLLLVADGEQRARPVAGAAGRRRTPPPARGSPATAPGSCPAPRRPGCGRARRRACRAPIRRRRTSAAGSQPCRSRSSKSSAARRALAAP